jgi:hypothetical protein
MISNQDKNMGAKMSSVVGIGTAICSSNAAVDKSKPHVATKWVTFLYFRLWPLGVYKARVVAASGAGIPLVAGVLRTKYELLEKLPWSSNRGHIIRSMVVGWLFVGPLVLGPVLAGLIGVALCSMRQCM